MRFLTTKLEVEVLEDRCVASATPVQTLIARPPSDSPLIGMLLPAVQKVRAAEEIPAVPHHQGWGRWEVHLEPSAIGTEAGLYRGVGMGVAIIKMDVFADPLPDAAGIRFKDLLISSNHDA